MAELTLEKLKDAVVGRASAFRCRTTLQPAGGEGDKVFPPTYAGAVYAIEKRRVPEKDEPVWCVCLDSVQSQANRMEDAMQDAVDRERLKMPVISVVFPDDELMDDVGTITSLEAPHRVADAILRDSELDGTAFRKSELGKRLDRVSNKNATPLFDLCPTALVFGMWDSTGPKGGLGAKFERAVVSEIIGYDAQFGVKTSSRIDPLQIRAAARVVKGKDSEYDLAKSDKDKGAVSPSEVNHGNIPPDIVGGLDEENGKALAGGVTVSHAKQTVVISLPQLRRLRFPLKNNGSTPEVDDAARTVLAALALCAATLAAEKGFDLRSRCLLWPTEPMKWEILDRPGQEPEVFELEADQAIAIVDGAVAEATKFGLPWRTEPLVLKPSERLMKLLQKSQAIAAAEAAAEAE